MYTCFRGVLDYLDNLNVTQIRKLYSMLCALAFRSQNDAGLVQDDMHIIIRKQLSNNISKYVQNLCLCVQVTFSFFVHMVTRNVNLPLSTSIVYSNVFHHNLQVPENGCHWRYHDCEKFSLLQVTYFHYSRIEFVSTRKQ